LYIYTFNITLHSILKFVIIPHIRKVKWGACRTKKRKEKKRREKKRNDKKRKERKRKEKKRE